MRTTSLIALLVFALGTFTFSPHAHAQEATASELAQKHFNRGARAYLEENYTEAVVQFLTAYRHREDPMILYNLSLAYQGLEKYGDALEAARRAGLEPDELPDDVRPRNLARIVALQQVLAAQSAAPEIRDAPGEAVVASGEGVDVDDRTTVVAHRRSGNSSIGALGWTGVATAAAGTGLLVYAGLLQLEIDSAIESYEARPTEAKRDSIEERQQVGKLVLYSGAGLFVLGTTLFVVDLAWLGDAEPESVGIAPTAGGAAFTLGWELP